LKTLKFSKTTLYKFMREGKITPVKHNHLLKRQPKLLFRRPDVEKLIKAP